MKVTLLVDDMDARAKNAGFAALDAHPNITVRLFNPFASRSGTLRMLGEGLMNFGRINHRMHNKSWIADNRIAIVGGRNLGDEYFGASEEVNFVDLDFALIGPVVRDASASFDKYWNSPAAYPVQLLDPDSVNANALEVARTKLAERAGEAESGRYAVALRTDVAVKRLATGEWAMEWSAKYYFASDDPLKATMKDHDPQRSQVMTTLALALRAMQANVTIISPYFVPGERGTAGLVEAAQAGKSVRILTSLPCTVAIHATAMRCSRAACNSGSSSLWRAATCNRASAVPRARACIPRRLRSTARRCLSAATISTRDRPG